MVIIFGNFCGATCICLAEKVCIFPFGVCDRGCDFVSGERIRVETQTAERGDRSIYNLHDVRRSDTILRRIVYHTIEAIVNQHKRKFTFIRFECHTWRWWRLASVCV